MYLGWTQVAGASELRDDVLAVDVGDRALVAVRRVNGYVVHDGRCPHRGAHLGHGGRLDGDVLVCPFHGHRVRLVDPPTAELPPRDPVHADSDSAGVAAPAQPFCVRSYPTLQSAAGLFVLLGARHDTGLEHRLTELDRTHHVHEAFQRDLAVPPEYVVENVFDADHFAEVHALSRRPRLTTAEQPDGSLLVEGQLDMVRPNQWQAGPSGAGASEADAPDAGAPGAGASAGFRAQVFSPTVVVTELRAGADSNVVVTAATPTPDGGCRARVTVALPRRSAGGPPSVRQLSSLISGSRTAFEQDAGVWEHLDTTVTPHYLPGDRLVQVYRRFCERFLRP
ncbi:MAG TPA: Rieske 2Fe-2S domain-containing protein [Microlunatus sp.]